MVELLVCIAIISILFAILHSVYSTAIQNSKKITCISNMRQIAIGFNMYRHDYDGSDIGDSYTQLGLPEHADAILQSSYLQNLPETVFACPNRFFNPNWQEREKLTKLSYSVYHSHAGTGYNFIQEQNQGNRPPLVYCSFHDLNFWKGKTEECNRIRLGIAIDGSVTKVPESKLVISCKGGK